jgi:hypothetical protein
MENEDKEQKPKRVRRKFDHPLTEEEKKENQKLYWQRWYHNRAKHNEKFMEKRRENAKKQNEITRAGRQFMKEQNLEKE